MQKFTVFSIVLSLVVVLAVADALFAGDLKTPSDSGILPPAEEGEALDEEMNTVIESEPEEAQTVELQTVEESSDALPSLLSSEFFRQAGFENPTLKETLFSGLVFEFLSFTDGATASIYQWNLFSGPMYVGTIYEVIYPTDTGGFQGYLNLRDAAKGMSDLGSVNEVNNYGDASFYFNHKVKTNTVHVLIRMGARLYGLEYAQSQHENMKKVFDILKTAE